MNRRGRPLDLAIVGMACRFPGADNLQAFWRNVQDGSVHIGEVPADRWNADHFFAPESRSPGRVSGRVGGYLDSPIAFDAASFGVMPLTVEGGEPEQFLILDTAREALKDAGLGNGVPDGRRVEVIVGRGNYFNRGNLTRLQHGRIIEQTVAILQSVHPEWTEADLDEIRDDLRSKLPPFEAATIPGQLTNATAGRVADRFNFRGASYVIDAASASALVALEHAGRALGSGRVDMVVVGAVYVQPDVDFPMVFSQLRGLSQSGRSRPFCADADGMVPGEGVGVLIIKRLRDAERDGDRVYAVVKGVGVASDGRGPGLAAPDARGHLRAMRRAYRAAAVDPGSVALFEGHGIGLPTSDRAELKALRKLLTGGTSKRSRYIGAVSSQIGHAMPAAGMAGLIKAALALHHRVIPVSLGACEPGSMLKDQSDWLVMNPLTRPWINGESTPRRAGVNAFGFAGVNAHAVLEEHSASADGMTAGAMPNWPTEAILLSAPDRTQLIARINELVNQLERNSHLGLKDVAFTLAKKPEQATHPARLGVLAASIEELVTRLRQAVTRLADPKCTAIRDGRGIYFWAEPLAATGKVAFLFPGEGSPYPGMLADLCPHFPELRAVLDTSDQIAMNHGAHILPSELLYSSNDGAVTDAAEASSVVNMVLSSQWGLYQLLMGLGLRPGGIVGHSSGEFLALAAANVIEVNDDFKQSLGDLGAIFEAAQRNATGEAQLVGVATSRERVEAVIKETLSKVSIAIDNCPHQVVIAGTEDALAPALQAFKDSGIIFDRLPMAHAYHTSSFECLMPPVRQFFQTLNLKSPGIPLYSCCSGRSMPADVEAVRTLAIDQWTCAVEFRRTIEQMHDDGYRVFVDVGARGNLAGFVDDTLRGKANFAIGVNLPRRSGLTQLNHVVAALFAHGVHVDATFLFARRSPQLIDLAAPPPLHTAAQTIELGFPEMSLSPGLVSRLNARSVVENALDQDEADLDESVVEEAMVRAVNHSSVAEWNEGRANLVEASSWDGVSEPVENHDAEEEQWVNEDLSDIDSNDQSQFEDDEIEFHFTSRDKQTDSANGVHLPWSGEVERFVAGHEVEATIVLDAAGDPVASHHTFGGRRVSHRDPSKLGLPVLPFTVMAEMLAQVAARLCPRMRVIGMRDVRARKWVRYEDEPIDLRVVARALEDQPGCISAALYNMVRDAANPAVEAIIVFDVARPDPAEATLPELVDSQISRFTARSMYEEQWLFHGPLLQAVAEVGEVADDGIDGVLRVLPRTALYRDASLAQPLTDPIVLDAFTHLLGLWGMERLPEGDVIFPLRLGSLEIFGDDPLEGADCPCRIRVKSVTRQRVTVDAEVLRPDGGVWMRLTDWDDWRFYWPGRFRDVFRQPDRVLVGEPLADVDSKQGIAVWLEPPADMAKPVWRDVLEATQLSDVERSGCLRPEGHDGRRTLRLWGRIAAKEAVRRVWLAEGSPAVYPADLTIEPDALGKPRLTDGPITDAWKPDVSIAHVEGVAVAIAARQSGSRVGIDIEPIVERSSSFETLAFSDDERKLLDDVLHDLRAEWIARFWCAKEAAAKAVGEGLIGGPKTVAVVSADWRSGVVNVGPGSEFGEACSKSLAELIRVQTCKRGNFAWAWAVLEQREPVR